MDCAAAFAASARDSIAMEPKNRVSIIRKGELTAIVQSDWILPATLLLYTASVPNGTVGYESSKVDP
jgi:hypothetical protein